MTPATGTDTFHLSRLSRNVVHDVVGTRGIATYTGWDVIETQVVPGTPRDIVVRARGIAADTHRTQQLSVGVVKRQAATKHVYAADFASHHRIVWLAVILGLTAIGDIGIHGVAVLQSIQAAARLNRAV